MSISVVPFLIVQAFSPGQQQLQERLSLLKLSQNIAEKLFDLPVFFVYLRK